MLIRFWFGLIHIGRPTGIGSYRYDVAATLCLWPRGDVPKGELQWHRILRVSWNWLPDRTYKKIGAVAKRPSRNDRLTATISGKDPFSSNSENELPSEYWNAFDSSRWTGRERKLVGIGAWRHELWSHKTTRRSKMYVYLTGSKERMGEHLLYVAPAATTPKEECPSDWFTTNEQNLIVPSQLHVKFTNGRAVVENNLGEWLIKNKYAQRTNSILRQPGKAIVGRLADAIAGR